MSTFYIRIYDTQKQNKENNLDYYFYNENPFSPFLLINQRHENMNND